MLRVLRVEDHRVKPLMMIPKAEETGMDMVMAMVVMVRS